MNRDISDSIVQSLTQNEVENEELMKIKNKIIRIELMIIHARFRHLEELGFFKTKKQ